MVSDGLNGREAGGAGGACISWYGQRHSVGVIVGPADIKVQTLLLCGQKWGLQGLTLPFPYPSVDTCATISIATAPQNPMSDERIRQITIIWIAHNSLTHGEDLQVARWQADQTVDVRTGGDIMKRGQATRITDHSNICTIHHLIVV
jgi:hypothetical protein